MNEENGVGVKSWVPLHVHSQYSILDSTISVQDIANIAKSYNMPAVALTDSGNMFGAVDFFRACKLVGIKPIVGCEIGVAPFSRFTKKKIPSTPPSFPIVLLAKNQEGYRNLCKLSSIGYIEGFYYRPRIDKEILKEHSRGLICLSGSLSGPISYCVLHRSQEELVKEVEWYLSIFKEDYYFELQRHLMKEEDIESELRKETWVVQRYRDYLQNQDKVIDKLHFLSTKYGVECVVTNDIHYKEREDWQAHEILLNIQSGEPCEFWEKDSTGQARFRVANPKRKIYSSHEFYFKSPLQMYELFVDLPEAVENTLKVAAKCSFEFDFTTKHYLLFTPPGHENREITTEERVKAVASYLYKLCQEALPKRYSKKVLEKLKEKYPHKSPKRLVEERLDYEFEVISSKGMCDYLLIVHDLIFWAKKNNIPVGPGRGSVAGSIISYLLEITDIEPLQFHLFFERFINPERISYPDIDVDICMERRCEVIDYILQKYGKDKVAQIITFGKMKARMAIKDVGRVLSVPLTKVNMVAKLVPEDPHITLEKAMQLDPELRAIYEDDEEARMIIDRAQKIEGSIRNTSIHAAGIIISTASLTNHIPVCIAKDADMLVTQYAMKPVEMVGLLKIDFLGLKTLTSIQKAVHLIEQNRGEKVDWRNLPLADKPTYNLLNKGRALGVFQLESKGMQELVKQLHIDHFEEIIAVCALYRPGPMNMIPHYINRQSGKEEIEIDHPLMREILEETYGVMVYQEQVMQIASALAGYSLGEGDMLRRAMGKKDLAEMMKQRKKFVAGAISKKIDEKRALQIFDKIEKFASYGFNKSHATAYAYLIYVTAYLKANYPCEWMAALMTCDRYDLSKVAKFIGESQSMDIAILPPDINEAGVEFVATSGGIRFAMCGIKGMGEMVARTIVKERQKGAFKSLEDFIYRIDTKRVGKKNVELLIDAGAFDFCQVSRDELRGRVDVIYEEAMRRQKEEARGILPLFSQSNIKKEFSFPQIGNKSTKLQILQREKELLGFYLTGYPMENYKHVLQRLSCQSLKEIKQLEHDTFCLSAFVVDAVKFKISRNQKKFAILTVSDGGERHEVPIWPALYEEKVDLLEENRLLCAILQIDRSTGPLKLQCRWLEDLTKIDDRVIKICEGELDRLKNQVRKSNFSRRSTTISSALLQLRVDADRIKFSHILKLKSLIRQNLGKTNVEVHFYVGKRRIAVLAVDSRWKVALNEQLKRDLKKLSGIIDVEISA